MSKVVDERVVSMQFDNRHFENNVRTTMSTLDKLKQSLNFRGAANGLNGISSSAAKVNLNPLSRSVEAVSSRFSAMEVIGITALANITNSAINAGKRIVSALTIDPVKTGFQEYETQINAVQTILANTQHKGSTIDDVNKALDELNVYADKTIYNFTEMTRNIGTFTAAGIDLETSVNAIQGIANLAAVSGSTSQQASTAMYQLSQALAAGTVKLMDWNSVVNAGMGGEMFQNALRETSELLGTGAEKAIEATGSFRESLREEWLTAEVLTETLKKFTTTGAVEYIAEYTDESQNAIEAIIRENDAWGENKDAIDKAAEAIAKKTGKDKDQIKQALQFAKNAEDAATKVKTLTQLWDVLKETAQSGWSQTWKLIFGDFEEAKSFFTPLADTLTGFVNGMSNARNRILEVGLAFSKPWEVIQEKLGGVKKIVDKVGDFADKLEYFQNVVNEVWRGDWKNSDTGRYELLDKAGYDHRVVQDLVNKGADYKLTIEDVEASHKKFGLTMEQTAEETKEAAIAFEELTDAQLKEAGLTEEEIRLYRALEKEAKKRNKSIAELSEEMSKTTGRDNLVESLNNLGSAISSIGKVAKSAWNEVFNPPSLEEMGVRLYGLTASLNEFTKRVKGFFIDSDTGEYTENVDKLTRTFKGLFAILKIITSVTGGAFKLIWQVVSKVLDGFNLNILDVTASIGDILVAFQKFLTEGNLITDAVGWLADGIVWLIKKIGQLVKAFAELDIIQDIFSKFKEVGTDAIEGLKNGLQNGIKTIPKMLWDIGRGMVESIMDALDEHSPSKEMETVGENAIQGLINGITGFASSLWSIVKGIGSKLVGYFKSIEWGKVFAFGVSVAMIGTLYKVTQSLNNLVSAIGGFGDVLGELGDGIKRITKAKAHKLNSEALRNMAISIGILALALIPLAYIPHQKLAKAGLMLVGIAVILIGVSAAMNKINEASVSLGKDGFNISGLKSGLVGIGIAVLLLAGTIALIGRLDPEAAKRGFWGLVGILTALIAFTGLYGKLVQGESAKNMDKLGKMLKKLAVSLLLMVAVVKLVSFLDADEIVKGAAFAAGFVVFVALLSKATRSISGDADKVAKLVSKVAFTLGLMVGVVKLIDILEYREMGKGLVFALGFTAFVKALVWATKVGKDSDFVKIGGLMMSVSASLLLMVGVCKLVGRLTTEELIKGGAFVAGFAIIIAGLIQVTKIGSDKQVAKVSATILAMSVAIGIMAGVAILLGLIDTTYLAKGILAVGMLSALMALMIRASKGVGDIKGNLIVMVVAIGLMAAAVATLSLLDPADLVRSTGALVAMMSAFALMISSTKKIDGSKLLKPLIMMSGVVLILTGIVMLLSDIENPDAAIKSAVALSLVLIALSSAMAIISKLGSGGRSTTKAIGNLTAMIIPLAAFAIALNYIPMNNIAGKKEALIVLAGVMGAMTVLLLALTGISALAAFTGGGMIAGIIGLTALCSVLAGFAWALNAVPMDTIASKKEAIVLLTGVMTVLTLLLLAVSAVGVIYAATGGLAVLGLFGLLGILALFGGFAAALNAIPMDNIAKNKEALMLLTGIMAVLTDLLLQISLVAPLAIIGVAAMTGLTGLMLSIGVFAVAIGALMEKFPAIQDFLNTGIPVIVQLAAGVGEMIGAFVDGIISTIASGLPEIGTNLSMFMTNAGMFIAGAKMVDESVLTGVNVLAKAIVALTAAELIAGISSFLQGGTSLADLGTQLSQFAINALPFFMASRMIDEGSMLGIKALAESIKIITASSLMEQITSWVSGSTSMSTFSTQLSAFGDAVIAFSDKVKGNIDEEAVIAASNAGKSIAQLYEALPKGGGWMQEIFGEASLETFAAQLTAFGDAIVSFSGKVKGNVNEDAVSAAVNSGKTIAGLYEALPKGGGWMQEIFGETNLATFGQQLVAFGEAIVGFSNKVKGSINEDAVAGAANAGKIMVELANSLPKDGSVWDIFSSEDNMDFKTFGEQITAFGQAMIDFSAKVSEGFDPSLVSTAISAAKKLISLFETMGGINTENVTTFRDAVKSLGKAKVETFYESFNAEKAENASSAVRKIVKLIKSMAGMDASGVATFKSALSSLATTEVTGFVKAFSSAAGKLAKAGVDMMNALVSGIKSGQSRLSGLMTQIADEAIDKFNSSESKFKTSGQKIMQNLAAGIDNKKSTIKTSVTSIVSSASSAISSHKETFKTAGKDLGQGLINGINAKKTAAYNAGFALGKKAAQGVKDGEDSNSPSKLSMQYGKWLGEGLIIGINTMGKSVYKAGYGMGELAADSISGAVSKIVDYLDGDMETQPTIRPVLDLTNVTEGAGRLNSLFNTNPSVGLLGNVGTIGAMMNSQNGANDDIVYAINKLGKKLDGRPSNSYTINGITYDDGSNVSNAVKDIVREIRMERRR